MRNENPLHSSDTRHAGMNLLIMVWYVSATLCEGHTKEMHGTGLMREIKREAKHIVPTWTIYHYSGTSQRST